MKQDNVPMKHEIAMARPSFGQTFKEGLAFGAGSSIAHSVIRSITGATVQPTTTPQITVGEYNQCMADYNDKAACAHLLDKE